MAQTDVRQDGADYNRLAHDWKESFPRVSRHFRDGQFDATSR
jgi:hypothetical protein